MRLHADRVAEILAHLGDPAAHDESTSLAERLVLTGRDSLPITGVSLVWMTDRGPGAMVAATDGPARLMEELQFSLGEGPCLDSTETGRPVLHGDLARTAPTLWPAFSAGALEAGIAAVFAFPLQVSGIRVGVLDLYRDVAGPLENADLDEAFALATAATTVLLDLQSDAVEGQLHPDLAEPMSNRAEVHQATGMIAVQLGTSLANALTALRARAFAAERPITDVAHDVVARNYRFTP